MDIDELAARAQIEDAIHTYARGIDRCDAETVKAAFHDDGILVDYGAPEPQPAAVFADYACSKLKDAYVATQHRVTNTLIDYRGDEAVAESQILAFHVQDTGDGKILHTFNGRWIDTLTPRDGVWRIAERVLRVDWTRKDPWHEDMAGNYVFSERDRSDVLWGRLQG